MKKKLLAMLLAAVMAVGLLPGMALAADSDFVIEDGWLFQYNGPGGDVVIPDGVTTIGIDAFYGCASLTSLTIPNSVTRIAQWAFVDCSGLTSITIPASVTHIDWEAFYCENLTDVYYGGSESQWGAIVSVGWGENPTFAEGAQGLVGLDNVTVHYNSTGPDTAKPTEPEQPTEPTQPATPAITFTDVPAGVWYTDAVTWAVENGITNGMGGSVFGPDYSCTNEQILTFLYRAVEKKGAASSEDVEKAVGWAREQNMIGDGFDRSAPCTRSAAVMYIWQALGAAAPASGSSFTDVPAGAPYAAAVAWAVEKGVTNGYSASSFGPNDTCTRGQIVTFLYRALSK